MKKTLALLLAAIMMLALVACGGGDKPADSAPADTNQPADSAPKAAPSAFASISSPTPS